MGTKKDIANSKQHVIAHGEMNGKSCDNLYSVMWRILSYLSTILRLAEWQMDPNGLRLWRILAYAVLQSFDVGIFFALFLSLSLCFVRVCFFLLFRYLVAHFQVYEKSINEKHINI